MLFTGASSAPGERVLRRLLEQTDYTEVWCGTHHRAVGIKHPKLRTFALDLASEVQLDQVPDPLDLVIHFAAITHAQTEEPYWEINLRGTQRLVQAARALGCRRFFYVSTRCATKESGAYGASKRAAEEELQKLDWESLVIVRPAEVYGGGTREGVDGFIRLASRLHVVPLLWGHDGIQFAPIHIDDLVEQMFVLLVNQADGVRIIELCGPEQLTGAALALRLAKRYRALPIPIWFSGLAVVLGLVRKLGWSPVTPDQLSRLVGPKTASCSSLGLFAASEAIHFPERASV